MGIIRSSERNSNLLPYISLLVKQERVKLGWKQAELAKKVGIGLKTLRKIEQGDLNVNFKKLNYLLNCLGLYLRPSDLIISPEDKGKEILSREYVLQIMKNILPILRIKYGVNELSLFGSYAKEDADPNSDIDVLIDFEKQISFEQEGEIQLILENLFQGKKVDLTIKSNLNKNFIKEVEETKINVTEEL